MIEPELERSPFVDKPRREGGVLPVAQGLPFAEDHDPLSVELALEAGEAVDDVEVGTEHDLSSGFVFFPSGETLSITTGPEGPGQRYHDPRGLGLPLLDTSGSARAKRLSAHFTAGEFAKSGGARFPKARISPSLVACVQAIRERLDRRVIINSGYRSHEHNERLRAKDPKAKYPVRNSRHQSGVAVDVRTDPPLSGVEIAKAAIEVCGCGAHAENAYGDVGIGLAPRFAHVDVRPEFAVWVYGGGVTQAQVEEVGRYHRRLCAARARTAGGSPPTQMEQVETEELELAEEEEELELAEEEELEAAPGEDIEALTEEEPPEADEPFFAEERSPPDQEEPLDEERREAHESEALTEELLEEEEEPADAEEMLIAEERVPPDEEEPLGEVERGEAEAFGEPLEVVALKSEVAELHLVKPATSLALAVGPRCYEVVSTTPRPASIRFEFDLSYGASKVRPPLEPDLSNAAWRDSVYGLEGKNITTHRVRRDGFRLEGDGNRIEIATKPFELSAAGRREMLMVMKAVLDLVTSYRRQCRRARPDRSLGFSTAAGAPRHFAPAELEAGVGCIVPLALDPKRRPYYRDGCGVAASPQATLSLPLAKVDALVREIKDSERHRVAGRAWSGPRGERQGDRSDALYAARDAVRESAEHHIRIKTPLSDGSLVSSANLSPTLQGLLILMVSYLRTSLLPDDPRDWEEFAKAYLPLNVKHPFRLLFADLTPQEKRVFKDLYDSPRTELWRLAKTGATTADGGNQLFPSKVRRHQECWFHPAPTWNDFVDKTVTNSPFIRTRFCRGKEKKGEDVGCEVLVAPLSRMMPYQPGSRRVTVEMRRLGFNWVFSHPYTSASGVGHPGWGEMTTHLFDLAVRVNR